MSENKLFYLQVPKTGGQTLATRLASAFAPQDTVILKNEFGAEQRKEFLALIAAKRFVEAHVRGQLLETVHGLDIIATVRDPVSQMISNFRHIRRDPANRWSRAALRLSPPAFFEQFGDFFTNHQTRYILSAFSPLRLEMEAVGATRAFHRRFFEALDKIRWLVPTESVDEFTRLWALETRSPVADFSSRVNVAPDDGVDAPRLRAFLQDRPHLYAFDTLLHQTACEAFSTYRDQTHEALASHAWPDNSRRAFADEGAGVWLVKNWCSPEHDGSGARWWAGPTTQSEVRIRRREAQRFLRFDVNVVNGISPQQIEIFNGADFSRIDVRLSRRSDRQTVVYAPLDELPLEASLKIVTPDCMASIMTTPTDDDLTRRSFLTSNWRLEAHAPD